MIWRTRTDGSCRESGDHGRWLRHTSPSTDDGDPEADGATGGYADDGAHRPSPGAARDAPDACSALFPP